MKIDQTALLRPVDSKSPHNKKSDRMNLKTENRTEGPIRRRKQLRFLLGDQAETFEDFEQSSCFWGNLGPKRKDLLETGRPALKKKKPGPVKNGRNGFLLLESLSALLVCMVAGFLIFASLSALKKAQTLQVDQKIESSSGPSAFLWQTPKRFERLYSFRNADLLSDRNSSFCNLLHAASGSETGA